MDEGKGYIALIFSALSFSLMSICVKQLWGRIPVIEMVFFRALLSLIITLFLIKLKKLNPWGRNKSLLILRGLLGTLALYCVFRALGKLPISSATVIQYTYPTFTALGAWIFLKEKISKRIWLAVFLGWIGICMVIQPDFGQYLKFKFASLEILIALLGAILTSMAYLSVRKLSKTEDELIIVYYFPLVSIILITPILGMNYITPSSSDLIWILGIGIFTQAGQQLITKGLKILSAAKASSVNYIQVIFASLWGVIFFEERIDLSTITGGAFVLFATLISISSSHKEKESLP